MTPIKYEGDKLRDLEKRVEKLEFLLNHIDLNTLHKCSSHFNDHHNLLKEFELYKRTTTTIYWLISTTIATTIGIITILRYFS